jgi:hypothetical protein
MDLSKIIAISGYPGLFKVVAQAHNGIIVESLIDKKRMQAFSTFKISALEDISIFTTGDDMPLKDVLKLMFDVEKGQAKIDPKAGNEELKAYLKNVLPNYDAERVHVSDIKKLITWYNLLEKNDLLKETEAENKTENTSAVTEEKPKVKKVASKTAAKAKPDGAATKAGAANTKGARKTVTVRKTGA